MSKTLSFAQTATASSGVGRHATAAVLRAASAVLARAARRLRPARSPRGPHLPVVEFHPYHRESGAPEGALYVDGELVGYVAGVTRL